MFLQDPRANCCPGSETVHVFILRQKIRISSIFLRLHPCHEEKSIKIIKIQYFNWHHILFYVVKFLHLQMLSKEPDLIACLPFCVSFFALFSKQWKHKWSEAVCVPPFSNLQPPHHSRILNALPEARLALGVRRSYLFSAVETKLM